MGELKVKETQTSKTKRKVGVLLVWLAIIRRVCVSPPRSLLNFAMVVLPALVLDLFRGLLEEAEAPCPAASDWCLPWGEYADAAP